MNQENGFYSVEEIRQRMSISTFVFWQHRPVGEAALEDLARRGIRRIELMESPEQFDMSDMRSMRHMGGACRSAGIEVAAYHAHMKDLSGVDTEAERTARVDLCRRQIDTMLDLGGTLWASHTSDTDATAIRCYEELARHVESTGAAIAVENFDRAEGKGVEDRLAFLDTIDHPQAGLLLDIGHFPLRRTWGADRESPMTVPGGPTQVLEACGRRLRHVHLHGCKDGVDHFPPFAEGDSIQWVELFRMLRAVGYSGDMNFELQGEPKHQNSMEAVGLVPERIVAMEAETP
jgi:sugar phosphate isomerase/epimerase